jgi:hypothetical protein
MPHRAIPRGFTVIVLAGGGLPPSPVSGSVEIVAADGTRRQVPFVIGAPNPRNPAIEGTRINPSIDVPRRRTCGNQEAERSHRVPGLAGSTPNCARGAAPAVD